MANFILPISGVPIKPLDVLSASPGSTDKSTALTGGLRYWLQAVGGDVNYTVGDSSVAADNTDCLLPADCWVEILMPDTTKVYIGIFNPADSGGAVKALVHAKRGSR